MSKKEFEPVRCPLTNCVARAAAKIQHGRNVYTNFLAQKKSPEKNMSVIKFE